MSTVFALFKQRNYTLLFCGTVASYVGSTMMLLTLAIWVKDLTGSSSAAAMSIFCQGVTRFLAPLAGWLADKVTKRSMLIGSNMYNAVALLPLMFVRGQEDVWLIFLVATLIGAGSVLIIPPTNGLIKLLVPEGKLGGANSLMQTAQQGLRLAGPVIGAGIYATSGGSFVAGVNIFCFVFAALAASAMSINESRLDTVEEERFFTTISAGFRFIKDESSLRRVVLGLLAGAVSFGLIEAVAFAMTDEGLDQPPEFVSVLVAVMGAGGLLGAVVAAFLIKKFGELLVAGFGLVALAVMFIGWTAPVTLVVIGTAVLGGASLPFVIVAGNTLIQRKSPSSVVGRVSSAADMMFGIPQVAGIAMGAVAITILDYRLILATMAVIVLSAAAYLFSGQTKTLTNPTKHAGFPQRAER